MKSTPAKSSKDQPYRRILGVRFFVGDAPQAVHVGTKGGLMVAPAAPALVDLARDGGYREALEEADLAITDSGFLVMLWNLMNADNIQRVPVDKWTSWRLHSVEGGETLADVARHYRVTVPAIENANHLEAHATLPAGFLLNVPTAPPVVKLVHYRVQKGDTLEGIAERFDVTVAEIRRWNHISGPKAPRGARLRSVVLRQHEGEDAGGLRRCSSRKSKKMRHGFLEFVRLTDFGGRGRASARY